MASYTFNKTINILQLETEINAALSVNCQYIKIAGDSFTVYFDATLSGADETLLNSTVTAHIAEADPETVIPYITSGSSLLTATIGNTAFTYLGSQSVEIHVSKESQGHFSSLKEAITANPYSDRVFIIHPGIYIENNPITMHSGCVIMAHGNAENTLIVAANPNSNILNMNVKCKLEGVNLVGATGAAGIYFNCAQSGGQGRYSAIMECFITNCNVALDVDGGGMVTLGGIPDTIYARELIIAATTQTLDKGVYVHNEGQFIGNAISVYGAPPTPAPTPAYPITYGYYCTDQYSKMAMAVANCYFCANAAYFDNNCSTELSLMTLKMNYNGVVIGPNGTSTRFSVNSLDIGSSTYKDVIVQSTNAQIEVHSGVFDDTKILNPNTVRLNMRYHTNKDGKTRQHMLGIINVGTAQEPAKMFIGQGSYDIYNGAVLMNTDNEVGTWTDNTFNAGEDTGVTFNVFSGTEVGNCLYLGRDTVPVGIKVNILSAATGTTLNDLVYEYWDGSIWVEFPIFTTDSSEPYTYLEKGFVAELNSFHIRFGLRSNSPLVNKTLNGITKKWVRVRVVNALSAIPTSDYILFHTSCTKINSDGFTEYFGDSRAVKTLSLNVSDMGLTDQTTGDQSVYLSKNINVAKLGNRFIHGQVSKMAFNTFLPTDLDSSFPIKLTMLLSSTSTGTVQFVVSHGFSNAGDNVYTDYNSAPTNATGEVSKTETVTIDTVNVATKYVTTLSIANIDINPSNLGPELYWVSISRDSTAGNTSDTNSGDVSIAQMIFHYVGWSDGAHLLNY